MKIKLFLVFQILMISVLCFANETKTVPAIAGKWVSFAWKSTSPVDKLVVTYLFHTNNTFSFSSTSTVQPDPIHLEGTFQILTNQTLKLATPAMSWNMSFSISNDVMILDDPRVKNWVKLRRIAEPTNPPYSSPADAGSKR